MAVSCGVTCDRAQWQQHFVVTQLHRSDALLVRTVKPNEHESSHVNLLRPCQVCRRGTTPPTRVATVDKAVW
jgi:hypothetical protein